MDHVLGPASMIGPADPGPALAHGACRFVAHALVPTVLALAFAMVSIPPVAASFMVLWSGIDWADTAPEAVRVTWGGALLLATSAALTSALLAGTVAGLVVRRHPRSGVFLALAIAWPVGVAMLSVTAASTGIELGIVRGWCETTCDILITDDPGSGLHAYLGSVYVSISLVVVAVPAAIVLALLPVTSRRALFAATMLAIGVCGALDLFSILLGGWVAFACLAAGVAAWVQLLVRPAPRVPPPSVSAAPDGSGSLRGA